MVRSTANNRIIFVNGKIGFGSPPAGKPFWESRFVEGARKFFPGKNDTYFAKIDFKFTDDCRIRFRDGQNYAARHYDELIIDLNKNISNIRIVTHSMGTAFGEGIVDVLVSEGWDVDYAVHINAWQPGDLELMHNDTCFVIDYQNTDDPLRYMITNKKGDIKGAGLALKESSGYKWYQVLLKHRSPIHKGKSFWKVIENALPDQSSLIGTI